MTRTFSFVATRHNLVVVVRAIAGATECDALVEIHQYLAVDSNIRFKRMIRERSRLENDAVFCDRDSRVADSRGSDQPDREDGSCNQARPQVSAWPQGQGYSTASYWRAQLLTLFKVL